MARISASVTRCLLVCLIAALPGCYAPGSPAVVTIELRDKQTRQPPDGPVWITLNPGAYMVFGTDAVPVRGAGPTFKVVLGPKIYYTIWVDAKGYDLMSTDALYPQNVSGFWLELYSNPGHAERPDRLLEMRLTVRDRLDGTRVGVR
jgi:hypothetical protein